MPTYRTIYRYHFKLGNKIIHTGITHDIDRREFAHRKEPGMSKGHIKQMGPRTDYDNAVRWQQEQAAKGKPIFDPPEW